MAIKPVLHLFAKKMIHAEKQPEEFGWLGFFFYVKLMEKFMLKEWLESLNHHDDNLSWVSHKGPSTSNTESLEGLLDLG